MNTSSQILATIDLALFQQCRVVFYDSDSSWPEDVETVLRLAKSSADPSSSLCFWHTVIDGKRVTLGEWLVENSNGSSSR